MEHGPTSLGTYLGRYLSLLIVIAAITDLPLQIPPGGTCRVKTKSNVWQVV
jgi:hypothetical protein